MGSYALVSLTIHIILKYGAENIVKKIRIAALGLNSDLYFFTFDIKQLCQMSKKLLFQHNMFIFG